MALQVGFRDQQVMWYRAGASPLHGGVRDREPGAFLFPVPACLGGVTTPPLLHPSVCTLHAPHRALSSSGARKKAHACRCSLIFISLVPPPGRCRPGQGHAALTWVLPVWPTLCTWRRQIHKAASGPGSSGAESRERKDPTPPHREEAQGHRTQAPRSRSCTREATLEVPALGAGVTPAALPQCDPRLTVNALLVNAVHRTHSKALGSLVSVGSAVGSRTRICGSLGPGSAAPPRGCLG